MRIAILHFHLRPGGVTRVIEMAYDALVAAGHEVLVVSGEPQPEMGRLPAHAVAVAPAMRYGVASSRWEELKDEVEACVRTIWADGADVLHLHNHALGKNFALPLAVAAWARDGQRLLLHIHDFAENGRPENYRLLLEQLGGEEGLRGTLYPVSSRIAYGLLNHPDLKRMQAARSCHWLPNPVILPRSQAPVKASELQAERLIVYPCRGIRRKNIGEALLLSAALGPGEKLVLTAPPMTPSDKALYARWKAVAERLRLPVVFEGQTLLGRTTVDFLLGASLCLTTSVTEGFGMAFLEPWLAGVSLAGRDLPQVTHDFRASGVEFSHLYERCDIPVSDSRRQAVEQAIRDAVRHSCESYQVPLQADMVAAACAAVFIGELGDFGRLPEAAQERILDEGGRAAVCLLPESSGVMERNRATIASQYSAEAYAAKLESVYRDLLVQPASAVDFLDTRALLLEMLDFGDFSALRHGALG
ncbi:glycosyltransferase [Terrimicrobium sacchariphilum]|uniref:Glycosyltransferase n=1 Tax=Terrimicrobium sacchariphilum TaxID=690879 RepID=A0A146GA00_TERSA|nr:glycosyltransferase [Terrimicrobium sacchariphilum]GAT34093.1 glycosyltransferase [Terrimicrobium sacchariphilum]